MARLGRARPARPITLLGLSIFFASVGTTFTPPAGSLTLGGTASPLDKGIATVAGSLSLTGAVPPIGTGFTPSSGALTVTGAIPGDAEGIYATAGSLALTGAAPSLALGFTPPAGAITLGGTASTLALGVRPPTGSLTLTGSVPSQDFGSYPVAGQLTITTGSSNIPQHVYLAFSDNVSPIDPTYAAGILSKSLYPFAVSTPNVGVEIEPKGPPPGIPRTRTF